MQEDPSSKVVLRSPSRDTDILVLATALLDSNRVHLDYGKGKLRKTFWLNQIVIEDQLKRALIGFHSFTKNDYVSPFSKKGRQMCWKALKKNRNFVEAFSLLGENWSVDVDDGIIPVLEQYVSAEIWRSSLTSWLDADEISKNGWLSDGSTYLVDDVFPREIEEILCNPKYIGNSDFDKKDEQSSSDGDDSDNDTYWDILIFKIEFLILWSLIIQ